MVMRSIMSGPGRSPAAKRGWAGQGSVELNGHFTDSLPRRRQPRMHCEHRSNPGGAAAVSERTAHVGLQGRYVKLPDLEGFDAADGGSRPLHGRVVREVVRECDLSATETGAHAWGH